MDNTQIVSGGAEDEDEGDEEGIVAPPTLITEDLIAKMLAGQTLSSELNHAKNAIKLVKGFRLFSDQQHIWTPSQHGIGNISGGNMVQLAAWQAQMDQDVLCQSGVNIQLSNTSELADIAGAMQRLEGESGVSAGPSVTVDAVGGESAEGVLTAANPAMLKGDQCCAFDIMRWHVNKTLEGQEPPPLRMILYSEGGTGKSKVIQMITKEFAKRGAASMLVKCAYTSVAASLIDGKTMLGCL